jgi:hypothetical protein
MRSALALPLALAFAACTPVVIDPGASTIPASIQGNWGLTAADCIPGRSDAKGLLVIGPTTLRFYESTGTLSVVAARTANRIDGTFAFSGEGQTWQRREILDVGDGDGPLVRTESGAGVPTVSYNYGRC